MRAYVFQNGESDLYAYSVDKTGANIPPRDPRYIWLLRGEIADLQRTLPAAEVGTIHRDLIELGFHLFKSDRMP